MNPNLKKRIESINKGIIPEGYKKTKVGIVPVEWETVRLKTISKHSTEKNKDLKYRETYTNSATQGIIKQTDYFDKQISNNENIDGYYVVRQNDYVYNPRISVSAPCGPISKSHFSETGVMSPLYTVFRLNDEYEDNEYIEHYFKSSFWYRYMSSVANYGARHDRMNITNDDLFNMPIPFPPLSEQQKIAEILSTQDKLIELQEKKIEQLKELKKAYLQKMFPKKGSKYPELRFKGFTEAWEQRKLGEISECLDSMRVPLNANERKQMQGDIPYYGAGSIQDYINKYLFDEELVLLLEDGDAFDDFKTKSIAQYISGKSWVNNHAHILRAYGNAFFLYISLAHKDIRNVIQLAGASRKKLVQDAMLRIVIDVPSIDEQVKIGEFFKQLDTLITLHQRKSEQEKQKKKALMQLLLTGIVRTK